MRGTSFSKRRNRWRVAGIEIDFGRLPLLKGRGPGHTPRIPTKVAGAIKTKIRAWRPSEATTLARLDTSKRFHSTVAPGIPGAFTNNHPEKKKEREGSRRFASFARTDAETSRRAASRRSALSNLVDSSNLRRECRHAAALLRMDLSAFPLCHSRVTELYDRRSCLSCGPPSR